MVHNQKPVLYIYPYWVQYHQYSSVTTTVFVVVMIILLMVLLICCIKTVMVCRRQKRVNDQRRRIMQRQAEANHQGEPRLFTIHQSFQLPGGQMPPMFLPEDMYRNWWKFYLIKKKQCLRIEPWPWVWNNCHQN